MVSGDKCVDDSNANNLNSCENCPSSSFIGTKGVDDCYSKCNSISDWMARMSCSRKCGTNKKGDSMYICF